VGQAVQTWLCACRASLFGTETKDMSPDRTQKRLMVNTIAGKARGHISNKQNSWKGGKASRRGSVPSLPSLLVYPRCKRTIPYICRALAFPRTSNICGSVTYSCQEKPRGFPAHRAAESFRSVAGLHPARLSSVSSWHLRCLSLISLHCLLPGGEQSGPL